MPTRRKRQPSGAAATATATATTEAATLRSAAVARLAGLPVATLRIWEQRHQAVQPGTTPAGHRLYAAADVQRVLMLRQLTQQGHAIGTIASLPSAQLQRLLQAQPGAAAAGRGLRALRLVVVGSALAARLQRDALQPLLSRPLQVLAVLEPGAEAAAWRRAARAELLVWQAAELRPELLAPMKSALKTSGAARLAVLYRFAESTTLQALAATGTALLREPADDASLARWLASISTDLQPPSPARAPRARSALAAAALPPRRYDDATLTWLASLTPALACECPRHLAELLMQLSSFEAYSAGCLHRHAADADLHAHLQRVAGHCRAALEAALDRVVQHEGLRLR